MTASKQLAIKALLMGALFIGAFAATTAKAETRPTTSDLYSYLVNVGPIIFNRAGASFLPIAILRAMKQGKVSSVLQFTLANNLLTQCVKTVLAGPPDIRDPYVVAKAKFDYGTCRETACFKQGFLLMLLPSLSTAPGQDTEGAKQTALMLAQSFNQNSSGCDGQGGSAIDPMIIALLTQQ